MANARGLAGVFDLQVSLRYLEAHTLDSGGGRPKKKVVVSASQPSGQLEAKPGWIAFSTSCQRNQSKPLGGVRHMGDIKLL